MTAPVGTHRQIHDSTKLVDFFTFPFFLFEEYIFTTFRKIITVPNDTFFFDKMNGINVFVT